MTLLEWIIKQLTAKDVLSTQGFLTCANCLEENHGQDLNYRVIFDSRKVYGNIAVITVFCPDCKETIRAVSVDLTPEFITEE